MTALRTTLAFHGPMPAYPAAAARTGNVPALLKNMALFLASPFIGLAYAVLLPFVGLGMLLWIATEGARKSRHPASAPAVEQAAPVEAPVQAMQVTTVVAAEEPLATGPGASVLLALKLLAAPFAGLAFVIALPFVALGALAWTGLQAACARSA
jgi:hypothetical protein